MSGVFTPPSKYKLAEIAQRSTVRNIRDGRNTSAKPEEPRAFTVADKSLIAKVHGYMPAQQLLGVLNERLQADEGEEAAPYTLEQLHAAIAGVTGAAPAAGAHDWSSLRKLVAKAKKDGTLAKITRQVIDDFAVVYSLSSGQVLRLQDVLLSAQEDS